MWKGEGRSHWECLDEDVWFVEIREATFRNSMWHTLPFFHRTRLFKLFLRTFFSFFRILFCGGDHCIKLAFYTALRQPEEWRLLDFKTRYNNRGTVIRCVHTWRPSTGAWTLAQNSVAFSLVPECKVETLCPGTGSVSEFWCGYLEKWSVHTCAQRELNSSIVLGLQLWTFLELFWTWL